MDLSSLLKYLYVAINEAWQHKYKCLFGFVFVAFVVLLIGTRWPAKFETSTTIFADNQNILRPLLDEQAAQSNLQDQTRVVKDMLHSPRMLSQVVDSVYGLSSFSGGNEIGLAVNRLRERLVVKGLGRNYIKISYFDDSAEQSYKILNTVLDLFLRESSEEKRSESREAFLFIDNQVRQYKDQLVDAENRLKEFNSTNLDGRNVDAEESIARVRQQIDELKLGIDEDKATVVALNRQLADESQYSARQTTSNVYFERLQELESRLQTLLLTYTEDYPDVVSLQYQISDIKAAIAENDRSENAQKDNEEVSFNPLYQELRSRLSRAKTDLSVKQKRVNALNELLDSEYERRRRIAARAAEEAELTRDYTVTRRIYEDMLESKERARLSMTLNIEGQGVSYRIQDPAIPPLNPLGLRFLHFVIAGPILGALAVIGVIIAFVLFDPRVRFMNHINVPNAAVVANIPHMRTKQERRSIKVGFVYYVMLVIVFMGIYTSLALAYKFGVLK
jgi:polysaccharide chain length determinant protein (PEP-CTERM system associated)